MAARRRDEKDGVGSSAEVMRAALNALAYAVFVFDEDGRYCDAFSADEELPVPAREIIGMHVRDMLPPSRAAEVEQLIRMTLDTGHEHTTEFPVEGGPRGRVHLAASFRVLRSPDGPRVLVTLHDLTEQELLARKLRELERRYQSLLDNAPDAIFVIDVTSGRFSELNERAVELFGVARERLLTMAIADVSPPLQADGRSSTEAIGDWLAQALAGDRPVFEWQVHDGRGRELPCQLRLERVPLAGQVAVRGSAVDLTEHKALTGKLAECRERLRTVAGVELRVALDELGEVAAELDADAGARRVAAAVRSVEHAVDAVLAELDRVVGD